MKRLIPILLLAVISCDRENRVDNEKVTLVIKNYYLQDTTYIKSVDDLIVDSIVAGTEKKYLEKAIQTSEMKYNFYVEAKDDEYADSTAKQIEEMQQKLKTADNTSTFYYTVYHTVAFTDREMIKKTRQSNLDITPDYTIQPNAVSENDLREGIQGDRTLKP